MSFKDRANPFKAIENARLNANQRMREKRESETSAAELEATEPEPDELQQSQAQLSRELRRTVEKTLREGEEVVGIWRGMRVPMATDAVVCTDQRVIMVRRAGLNVQTNSFRYEDIESVHVTWGSRVNPLKTYATELELALAHGPSRSLAAHIDVTDSLGKASQPNLAYFGSGPKQDAAVRELIQTIEDRIHARSESDAAKPASSGSSTDLLVKLGELHRVGVLTDQEFEDKKAEILRRI